MGRVFLVFRSMYDNLHFYTFGISLLINIVFGGFIIYNQRERKRIYRILNDLNNSISEKNQAILEQAAKLSEAFENLWTINQRLDEEVLLRTDSITRQHREMIKSIHFLYTQTTRNSLEYDGTSVACKGGGQESTTS